MNIRLFGRNNHQLFKNKTKPTYSIPQKYPLPAPIIKCACGYDFILTITHTYQLQVLYQNHIYIPSNLPKVIDLATCENTIVILSSDGDLYLWEFDWEKVEKDEVKTKKIQVELEEGDSITQIEMGYQDIFLLSYEGKIYHFSKNEWYETKTYSQIQWISFSQKIIDVTSGLHKNIFLTYQGQIYQSQKDSPLQLNPIPTSHKFIKISASSYYAGISKKGNILIWGNSMHGNYEEPIQFSKMAKKFVSVKLNNENGFGITDDGEMWGWGINKNGQLGLSDYQPRNKPFPIITLDKFFVFDVFCGQNYTCTMGQEKEKGEESLRIKKERMSTFTREKKQLKKEKKRKSSNSLLREANSGRKKNQNNSFRLDKKHLKSIQNKSCSVQKSPSNPKQSSKSVPKMSNSVRKCPLKTPTKSVNKSVLQTPNECIKKSPKPHSKRNEDSKEVQELRAENNVLRQKVTEQNELINDITVKIRLLEEAIEEHEQNLTGRDGILEQYEKREKEYQSHVEQLQRSLEELIQGKQKNHEITVIYEDLKTNFEKEREYYMEKIKNYEQALHQQQIKYQKETDYLQHQISSLKSNVKVIMKTKERGQDEESWQTYSPLRDRKMEEMINRIESNKSRISKSANKLIAMLDMS